MITLYYYNAGMPENLRASELNQARKEKKKQMKAEGKEVLLKFLEDQIQKAIDYLKDEKNREGILEIGIAIVKKAIGITK